jgi:DnaA-homolog protein
MNKQLTLGVTLRDDATFDNFYVGDNHQILEALRELVNSANEQFIFMWSEASAGISHLLQACCHEAFHCQLQAIYLPLSEPQFSPQILEDLEIIDLICVDDLESVLGKPEWEEALLHLYNRVRDASTRLVIGAKNNTRALPCQLPDLKSRLSWGLNLKVNALTDEEKLIAILMRADQRGLSLSESVGLFLLRYYSRDMGALFDFLDQLDKTSLAAKRRVTIPFVKEVLNA